MKKIGSVALALVIAAAGTVVSASSASALYPCATVVSYDTAAIWVKETTFDCYGQKHRAMLYYFMSSKGATTYTAAGPWKGSNLESKASTSSSRFFAGSGTQIR